MMDKLRAILCCSSKTSADRGNSTNGRQPPVTLQPTSSGTGPNSDLAEIKGRNTGTIPIGRKRKKQAPVPPAAPAHTQTQSDGTKPPDCSTSDGDANKKLRLNEKVLDENNAAASNNELQQPGQTELIQNNLSLENLKHDGNVTTKPGLNEKVLDENNVAASNNEEQQPSHTELIRNNLLEVETKAEHFEDEIRNFTELADSNKYYYIEESLKRLIDKLDDMYDDISVDKDLLLERKKVYRVIFGLFDKLDMKLEQNKLMQGNNGDLSCSQDPIVGTPL